MIKIAKSALCFCLIVLLSCACHNKNNYDNLSPELAKLCKEIDKHPKNADAYYKRALYYYDKGFMDKAKEDAFNAIKYDDKQSKYFVLLSDLYFAEKETDLTEENLQKAIQIDPDNNEARLKLAELYYHLRMFNECNAALDEAVKKQNHNPKAHLIRAFCLKEQKDTVGCLRMLQLTIDQDPTEIKAFLELGYYYQQKLDPLAISYYQNALNVQPDNVEINFNLAVLFQDLGNYEQAIAQYKTLLKYKPDYLPALNNLGYIYLVFEDQYDESIALFTKALNEDSTFVNAVCNRGLAFECKEEYDKARQDYRYALQLQPNFEEAVLGLNRLDKVKKKK